MSKINEKSPKHCAQKQSLILHKFNKNLLFYCPLSIFLTILSLILLLCLILHPSNPKFSLQQADLIHLNLSSRPSSLNSSIQLTLLSHNPNNRVGIYYDHFLLYASYKGHNITPNTSLTPFYQGHQETNPLSALLVGHQQSVPPYLAYQVQREHKAGTMVLSFEARGRLRWKVRTWVSGKHRFSVTCVTTVMPLGTTLSPPKQGTECSTSI